MQTLDFQMSATSATSEAPAKVVLYTTLLCSYCNRAKALLRKKGVAFTEIDVGMDAEKRAEMTRRAHGRHTVPQIFIDGKHVGGCDDLHDLDDQGKLDLLLQEGNR
jgi:glutaredoxin 3